MARRAREAKRKAGEARGARGERGERGDLAMARAGGVLGSWGHYHGEARHHYTTHCTHTLQ